MKRLITALAAATILTAAAHAGHSMHHNNPRPDNRPGNDKIFTQTNKLVSGNPVGGVSNIKGVSIRHRDRLPYDCSDFGYCYWAPSYHCYCFWCPTDACWFYWYAPWNCYLPYSQMTSYPPPANVVPKVPGGLPPLIAKADAGPPQDGPPMPPADGQTNMVP